MSTANSAAAGNAVWKLAAATVEALTEMIIQRLYKLQTRKKDSSYKTNSDGQTNVNTIEIVQVLIFRFIKFLYIVSQKEQFVLQQGQKMEYPSLLSGQDRDFLIRSNGEQVKVSSLRGKKALGLYFSASWCGPCQKFTPKLLEAYEELSKSDFEVVFISSDKDDESFTEYFSKMPWLAVPFSDSDVRASMKEMFNAESIPHLVVLDAEGKVSCRGGVKIVRKYGAEGYPFTEQKLRFLIEEEENARRNQTLRSLLVSSSRDYLISNDGTKVIRVFCLIDR
ncbi:Probable nucleoredoxin 1 [Linum perenne]